MTDYTFKMEVRTSDTINTDDLTNSALILSTADTSNENNKQIVPTTAPVDLAAGDVSFTVDADIMKGVAGGAYVYDIQAIDSTDKVTTWLYGAFIVNEDVSV